MTREFVYMPEFDRQWIKCGLKDLQQREFEAFLCEYPEAGSMIQGTGGLRKFRWNLPGKGKSGGIRILYVDFPFYEKIYLITCFPKSIKVSLSQEEKKAAKVIITSIKNILRGNNL